MRPIVLLREEGVILEEKVAIARYFPCTNSRMDIKADDLVIGRYSVLPFYDELERDLCHVGATLINTGREHHFIADVSAWAGLEGVLEGLTPAAWSLGDWGLNHTQGPFVVKGATNSKKQRWNTHMYASTRADVGRVVGALMDDTFIGQQDLYVRPYEPFYKFMTGENGLPITREFRFFMYRGRVLAGGFYWSSHVEQLVDAGVDENVMDPQSVPREFLENVAIRLAPLAPFTAVDVAWTDNDEWRVVEVNDGQMSGLSEVNPDELYGALAAVLDKEA